MGAAGAAEVVGDEAQGWDTVGIPVELQKIALELGLREPTPMQSVLIPAARSERNVLAETPAGTGRTVAIGIIVADLVNECDPGEDPVALVLTSSDDRCLEIVTALQTCGAFIRRTAEHGLRVAVASELGPLTNQARRLAHPVDAVVGTPSRVAALMAADHLAPASIEMVIVDQADDLAVGDMAPDLKAVLDIVPEDRQRVVLAGAVLSPLLDLLANRLPDPVRPTLPQQEPFGPNAVDQIAYAVQDVTPAVLGRILRALGADDVIVVADHELARRLDPYLELTTLPARIVSLEHADDITDARASHLVVASLPPWTSGYAQLLALAQRIGARQLVLLAKPSHRHLLRAFGRIGGVQLNAAPVPSEDGIRALQADRTEQIVREQLFRVASQPTPRFLASVHRLASEFDIADVAAAAIEVAHRALQRQIEPGSDIPMLLRPRRTATPDRRQTPPPDTAPSNRRRGGDRRQRELEPGMIRLFVAAGYNLGVRPGDIVGAFAGESGLSGKDIGNIDIRESFTLVEVPEAAADEVIEAMRRGTIKGRQIEVRRERY